MTATPIPRTLSLTAYGDLDATTIRELPAGRRPVRTWVVGEEKRAGAYEFIRERLREGRQAYVVCPLVEDSEKLQAKAAGAEAERLARGPSSPTSRSGCCTARCRRAEKSEAMEAFAPAARDVLVATTRDRGRHRRRQRDRDADRGRRALRALPAPPAPRPGRSRRAREPLHPLRRSGVRARRHAGWRRSPRPRTASSSPRWTWRCAARARSSAPASTACPGSGSPSCPSDAALLAEARREVLAMLRRHGEPDAPGARAAARRRARALRRRAKRGIAA